MLFRSKSGDKSGNQKPGLLFTEFPKKRLGPKIMVKMLQEGDDETKEWVMGNIPEKHRNYNINTYAKEGSVGRKAIDNATGNDQEMLKIKYLGSYIWSKKMNKAERDEFYDKLNIWWKTHCIKYGATVEKEEKKEEMPVKEEEKEEKTPSRPPKKRSTKSDTSSGKKKKSSKKAGKKKKAEPEPESDMSDDDDDVFDGPGVNSDDSDAGVSDHSD